MPKLTARDKVISAAQELMVGRGYRATTVDEIVSLAGVAKGSFYHSFKSKEELAIAALEAYERRGWDTVASGPYLQERDPIQRAFAFVQYVEDISPDLWSHGCLLGSVALEVAETYPGITERAGQLFERFENGVETILAPALKAGKVTRVDAHELSVHLMVVIEGGIIAACSHGDPRHLKNSLRHFSEYLRLLLAAPAEPSVCS